MPTSLEKKRTRSSRHSKPKKRFWPTLLKGTIIVALMAVVAVLGYGAKLLTDAEDLMENNYRPRSTANGENTNDKIIPRKDPFSILLLGVDDNDERELGSNRTDTMILVTVNPKNSHISMVSIPRDTYTHIEGKDYETYGKINSAYTIGKEESSIKAVEELVSVPVNFYVTVDFEAFEKIVDALDGIEVKVPVEIHEANAEVTKMIHLKPGKQTLNGEQALAFARTRKIDNDIKRGERQQMVVEAVIHKAMQVGSIGKYSEVLNSLNNHFWTDINKDTMMQIAKSGFTSDYKFKSYTFSWMSFNYEGQSMVGLHEDSLDYISHKLNVELGNEEEDERDQEDYVFESNNQVSYKTYPSYGAVDDY